jgi:hypothetical protein
LKFFCRFKIDELIQEHEHEILSLPPYHCHFNPIELVWLQVKRCYTSTISQNEFGMEAVTNMWQESLQRVCFLCSLATRQKLAVLHKILSITTFYNMYESVEVLQKMGQL